MPTTHIILQLDSVDVANEKRLELLNVKWLLLMPIPCTFVGMYPTACVGFNNRGLVNT